jgi:hypothetical protein
VETQHLLGFCFSSARSSQFQRFATIPLGKQAEDPYRPKAVIGDCITLKATFDPQLPFGW